MKWWVSAQHDSTTERREVLEVYSQVCRKIFVCFHCCFVCSSGAKTFLKPQTGDVSDSNLFCYGAEVLWEMLHADICVGVIRTTKTALANPKSAQRPPLHHKTWHSNPMLMPPFSELRAQYWEDRSLCVKSILQHPSQECSSTQKQSEERHVFTPKCCSGAWGTDRVSASRDGSITSLVSHV